MTNETKKDKDGKDEKPAGGVGQPQAPSHLICRGCKKKVPVYLLGAWCDDCGGIMSRSGALILRHVATVDGPGGRFPIVYDASTHDYSCSFSRATPRSASKKHDEDGFRIPHITTLRGTLDAVLALMQPIVRGPKNDAGDPPPMPVLTPAPTTTAAEKALLLL